jgi:hypothetical protein
MPTAKGQGAAVRPRCQTPGVFSPSSLCCRSAGAAVLAIGDHDDRETSAYAAALANDRAMNARSVPTDRRRRSRREGSHS